MGMNAVSVVITIAGAIAGPGYYFYCDAFSGENVGTFLTSDRLGINLDPQMNPVSIDVSMSKSADGNDHQFYMVSLQLGRRPVAEGSFSASPDSNVVSYTLDGINVPEPGEYDFRIENLRQPGVGIPGVEVSARRNTRAANMSIVWTGVVLLVLGLWLNSIYGRYPPGYER